MKLRQQCLQELPHHMSALKFGTSRKPTPYFRPSFHLRLIGLAILLGILAAGLEIAWRRQSPQVVLLPEEQPQKELGDRARPEDSISPAPVGGTAAAREGSSTAEEPGPRPKAAAAEPFPDTFRREETSEASSLEVIARSLPTSIPLRGVEDNRRVVPSEWDEWLKVFAVLRAVPVREILSQQVARVSYLQLVGQPEVYRGKLIKTAGVVRRAHRTHTPKNPWGLETYHQLWLQVDDHPTDPVAVWVLDLPERFPLGMSVEERAEVVGYFFKIMPYLAADGTIRRAPLILARTVAWMPRPTLTHRPRWEALPYVFVAAGVLAAMATFWIWRRTASQKTGRARSSTPPAFLVSFHEDAITRGEERPGASAALAEPGEGRQSHKGADLSTRMPTGNDSLDQLPD